MKYKLLGRSALSLLLLLVSLQIALAQFVVSGRVSDAAGEGLPGATVAIVGAARGATTDVEGRYRVEVPGSAATLTFSYTGFKTVSLQVTSSNTVADVVLEEDFAGLDEVVVSGLATNVKRSNLANAVASISSSDRSSSEASWSWTPFT